jgi:hypothetical protein
MKTRKKKIFFFHFNFTNERIDILEVFLPYALVFLFLFFAKLKIYAQNVKIEIFSSSTIVLLKFSSQIELFQMMIRRRRLNEKRKIQIRKLN